MDQHIKIGIIAGEISGDLLGAELIPRLKKAFPNAEFQGIGGEKMIAQGFSSLFPMERLSVMGFVEPLKRLPELLAIRKSLYTHFLAWNADLVLGIDSPDFTLGLERKLKAKGLITAHYVSPSVWAWRQGRVKKIAQSVDRMLTLLPFEADFYRQHQVPVTFVGHPLADSIPLVNDRQQARKNLKLKDTATLAIMPGSRGSEVSLMGDLFLQVAEKLLVKNPELQFVIPAANKQRYQEIKRIIANYPQLPITLIDGDSQQVMAASDCVLLTSGTTALEAMLLKKPMVVAYRMGAKSYWLASKLVKIPYISLPNLIAEKMLVPELIQDQATVENLESHCRSLLFDEDKRQALITEFQHLHLSLQQGASDRAADVLIKMITDKQNSELRL